MNNLSDTVTWTWDTRGILGCSVHYPWVRAAMDDTYLTLLQKGIEIYNSLLACDIAPHVRNVYTQELERYMKLFVRATTEWWEV